MKKRIGSLMLACVMVALLFAACGGTGGGSSQSAVSAASTQEAASTGTSEPSQESKGTIKVGLLVTLSGFQASSGVDAKETFELFLEEHGNQLGGYDVELFVEDDETTPATTLTKAKKLVEVNEVDIIIGPANTACANAIIPYLEENEVPLVMVLNGGDEITQSEQLPYTVRICSSSSQCSHPLGEYVATEMGHKKAAVFGYDFQFGYEVLGGFKRTFEENGGEVVYAAYAPTATNDFAPYLMNMPKDVDCIYWCFTGADATRFVSQLVEYDYVNQYAIYAGYVSMDETLILEFDPSCEGIVSPNSFSLELDNPAMNELKEKFEAKYDRRIAGACSSLWSAGLVLDNALSNMDSISDHGAIITEIRGSEVACPTGVMRFDEYGQSIHDVLIRELQMVDGKFTNVPIKTYESVSQFWKWTPEEYLAMPSYEKIIV